MGLEDKLPNGILLTNLERFDAKGGDPAVRPMHYGSPQTAYSCIGSSDPDMH